jgi:hypothetical protein
LDSIELNFGQRVALPDVVSLMNIEVGIDFQGIAVDVSCFDVDAAGRLADERYMTFFNQLRTPCLIESRASRIVDIFNESSAMCRTKQYDCYSTTMTEPWSCRI